MYKDKEKQQEANRIAAQRRREKAKGMTLEKVIPSPSNGWPDVMAYIQRDSSRMGNLERLQRIAGSLGKNAGEVWFGVTGLTMEDIGGVIGTLEPLYEVRNGH